MVRNTVHLDPRDHAPRELMARAAALSLSGRSVRRWLGQVIGRGECSMEVFRRQGIIPQRVLEAAPDLPRLALEQRLVSESGFQKLVFRTADDLAVESVIIPLHKAGAFSVCLSSQIGCVMRCEFCATGRMSVRRDLETWEIVDQFIQARELIRSDGSRVTGAVFMGMGEPFLNYERVLAAAELLSYPVQGAISAKAITISTVGLVPQIRRYTAEGRRYRLSISLGAATDEKRAALLPLASQTPLAEVMRAAGAHAAARRCRIMLSYVCIGGFNVSEEDARALGDLIGDIPVRLDLIDVNDTTGRYLPPEPEELNAFRDALRRYVGQPVVRRYSGGADIAAACGSLAGDGTLSTQGRV